MTAAGRPNFRTRTVWTGDNLDILRGINSESVDLIYLDPPFNSNKQYSAPVGSRAAGAAFKDTWTLDDVDEAWHGEIADRDPGLYAIIGAAGLAHSASMKSYLIMMAVRLLEMKRVLRPTGSIYLHCDPTASHYLKTLMDAVFGVPRFRNEIVWSYRRWPSKQMNFQRMHDVILRYAKGDTVAWNQLYEPPSESYLRRFKGKTQVLDPDRPTRKLVVDKPTKGLPLRDVWTISIIAGSSKERLGYPTQKPLKLLDRIIRASSNPGDMILDPFCGCATALVAAETLGRRWAGIDLSPLAVKLVGQRLRDHHGLFGEIIPREDIPKRSDLGKLPNYRTHRHTLYGRQEGVCNGCLVHFPFRNMTVDHVVSQSRGGSDHIENLQLLCGACNSKKGGRPMEALVADLLAEGIRNGDTYRSARR
ncbi:MAG: DNA methyltransferase [Gammaproteobacteria bacterium]|nr:DNA methyltransferase [Gammaproteobacteria bacterium]